jgi:hypothetical protein
MAHFVTSIAGTSSSFSLLAKKDDDGTVSHMCQPMFIPSKPDKVSTSKKVNWDYDTPQSRKCREAFAK